MNNFPIITIGLPCYDSESTVKWTIQSILQQTYTNWELIIIDDGSSDRTLEIIREYESQNIRIISDGKNLGLPARLNQVAELAQGEFLARMDADDIMFPERLEKQLALFENYPETDLAGSGVVSIDHKNMPTGMRIPPEYITSSLTILNGEVLYHPTVMGRTAWFRENHYDTMWKRSQDFELWSRAAGSLCIRNLQEPLLFYREQGQLNWQKYATHSSATKKVISRYGPKKIGVLQTILTLGRRCMKDSVYFVLLNLGLSRMCVKFRNSSLSTENVKTFNQLIHNIEEGTLK